ncbi:MAG TPA: fibronectin type III domain-containing protein [Rubrivivax sp.]|nr:fibronectin type III domain-containing protein [Rubrivivax sp.]
MGRLHLCLQLRCATLALAAAGLLSGGCGGGSGAEPAPSPAPAPAPAPATATGTAVLTWDAPDDAAVVGYRVYYGTAPRSYAQFVGAGLEAGFATTYVVSGLQRGSTYYFAVTAFDAAGNESAFSNEASKRFE